MQAGFAISLVYHNLSTFQAARLLSSSICFGLAQMKFDRIAMARPDDADNRAKTCLLSALPLLSFQPPSFNV
jgi:hypothetical protein